VNNAISQFNDMIVTTLKSEIKRVNNKNEWNKVIAEDNFELNDHKIKFYLCVSNVELNLDLIKSDFGDHYELVIKHLST